MSTTYGSRIDRSWHVRIDIDGPPKFPTDGQLPANDLRAHVFAMTEGDCRLGAAEIEKLYVGLRRFVRAIGKPEWESDFSTGSGYWKCVVRLSYINEPGPEHALSGDAAPIAYIGLGEAK